MVFSENMNNQLRLLRDLIHVHTGLFFRDYPELEFIATRLQPRVDETGCSSLSEYCRLLNEGGNATANEWLHVITALSRRKSSFLRHRKLADVLATTIIPRLLSSGDRTKLRIWSAGCSTGEEPLTIAMALDEAGLFDRLDIEINASDANFVGIETARRGVYDESRVKDLPTAVRLKYFKQTNEGWQVIPELHKRIQWTLTNLIVERDIAELASSDVIFCHNVFIYFSKPAICQTVRFFESQMPRGGYLSTDNGEYYTELISHLGILQRQQIPGASIWMKSARAID